MNNDSRKRWNRVCRITYDCIYSIKTCWSDNVVVDMGVISVMDLRSSDNSVNCVICFSCVV